MKYYLAYFYFGAIVMREGSSSGKYTPATRAGILALKEAGACFPHRAYGWSIAGSYTRTTHTKNGEPIL